MKSIIPLLLFVAEILFSHPVILAQNILWQKCYGGSDLDYTYASAKMPGGGFVLGGFTYSGDGNITGFHGGSDVWVQCLSDSGNLLWQRCIGGSGMEDCWSVCQSADQGYIVAGYSNSSDGDISVNHGYYDVLVMKLDSAGEILWLKSYGGTGFDRAISVICSPDSGYLVTGYTDSDDGDVSGNHGGVDFWILKLDQDGNKVWQKCLGGSGDDYGHAGIRNGDNGYILAGTTESNDGDVSGNHGAKDFWVVELDTEGNIAWQKCFGGSNDDAATCLVHVPAEGFAIAGYTMSFDGDVAGNHGFLDMWVVRLNESGDLVWQTCLGGTGEEMARDIEITPEGKILIAGYANSQNGDVTGCHGGEDAWLLQLDLAGHLEWQKCYGGSQNEQGRTLRVGSDGGYFLGGYSFSDDGDVTGNHGNSDSWALKLTGTLPDPVFSPPTATSVSSIQFTISSDPGTTIFYSFDGSDPGCNSNFSGTSPLLLNTADSTGTYMFKAIACQEGWNPSGISTAVYHVVPVGITDWTVSAAEIQVFPNPVSDLLYLDLRLFSQASVKLIDARGRMIYEKSTSEQNPVINISTIPTGVYILRIIGQRRASGAVETYTTNLQIR